jgi:PTH1 family peptidyl-tRNA hydrolase
LRALAARLFGRPVLLFVGLGNPGPNYAWNRHNVGFMALDGIVQRHGFGAYRARFHGLLAGGRVDGERVIALKPTTYMNRSGIAVSQAARFYKLEGPQVVVIHDDIDLAPGKVRVKTGGGSAGHNGLKSIDGHFGKAYRRVRIGIGHPGDRRRVESYVLQDFAKDELAWLEPVLDAVVEAAPYLVRGDDAGFMNRVAARTRPEARARTDGGRGDGV